MDGDLHFNAVIADSVNAHLIFDSGCSYLLLDSSFVAEHENVVGETMEAVMTEEVEGIEPNQVIDVLQKGYTYKGKVIRYAMVKVSK